MLKLIIADDEKILRETISNIIDWKKYDIEVIGLCRNGLETYDMILDENPDIVLTDIRMPGMDGLELIQKTRDMDLDIQFIILSGYGEFSYARQAMKNGVKHYLLKPCNETQIIECIEECRRACMQHRITATITENQFTAISSMHHNVISNILNDCICQKHDFSETLREYESYLDFSFTPYRLFYAYFVPFDGLNTFLEELKYYCQENMPAVTVHGVYVNNTLLLFFKNYATDYQSLTRFIEQRHFRGQNATPETESVLYPSLETLLTDVIAKVRRYGIIYYINHFRAMYTCTYNQHIDESEHICQAILQGQADSIELLVELLDGISDLNFLKQLSSSLLLKLTLENPALSTIELTDCLMQIENENNILLLKSLIIEHIQHILAHTETKNPLSHMTKQVYAYVEQNLSNPNLNLKYIAEHHLYMNVDYVSKKFLKESGVKFSTYLTDMRIRRAKELLLSNGQDKIQNIAEEVGLGNNPQYFSRLFKKKTGMTPSTYLAQAGCPAANKAQAAFTAPETE